MLAVGLGMKSILKMWLDNWAIENIALKTGLTVNEVVYEINKQWGDL